MSASIRSSNLNHTGVEPDRVSLQQVTGAGFPGSRGWKGLSVWHPGGAAHTGRAGKDAAGAEQGRELSWELPDPGPVQCFGASAAPKSDPSRALASAAPAVSQWPGSALITAGGYTAVLARRCPLVKVSC